jgi:hypothetical protein
MSRGRICAATLVALGCLFTPVGQTQPLGKKASPKLEPVAETKLLMAGIAEPNLRGIGQILKNKPKDVEGWAFARGQALLVAETGNLLMMRPPQGRDPQDTWMALAAELRDNGTALARSIAAKDYVQSRTALATTANTCNRCHQRFSVAARVNPFPDE